MEQEDSELTQAAIALANATVTLSQAITTMQQALEKRVEGSAWLTPRQAAAHLGVKPLWILTRIRDGRYKHGVHYVDTSDGDRPKYRVSMAAIQKELIKPPEKRKPATKT
jgi:hypothetical protein